MLPVFGDHDALATSLAKSVKRRRKKLGLKQGAVGHAAGYDNHSIISKIEHGKAVPALDKAFLLAQALGASSIEELVTDIPTAESLLMPLVLYLTQWSVARRHAFAVFLRQLADLVEMTALPSASSPSETISRNP